MSSNIHSEDGKGNRRTRSGRSSRRSSRADTVDGTNELLSRRTSRHEDERKSQRTRQKLELRAKQMNNADEELTRVDNSYPSRTGHAYTGLVTSQDTPYTQRSFTTSPIGTFQEEPLSRSQTQAPGKPAFEEWLGEQFPETRNSDQMHEDMERLTTLPIKEESLGAVSAKHRWGRVFAERGTPLTTIGAVSDASRSTLLSPGASPLQRRAAIRRRRLHDSSDSNPINLVELSESHRLPPPITPSERNNANNSPDISPVTPTDHFHWNKSRPAAPMTSTPRTLPLSFRLPLTPTKTSPIGGGPGPSTPGLPQQQDPPTHAQASSTLSVPNSPAYGFINTAYSSEATSPSANRKDKQPDLKGRFNITTASDRARSVSPMVLGNDRSPRLHGFTKFDESSPVTKDRVRHGSPRLVQSLFSPPASAAAQTFPLPDDDTRAGAKKPSKGNKTIRLRCVMCTEKQKIDKMIQAPQCMHFLCASCVKDLFARAIHNPEIEFPAQCCKSAIPVESVSGILSLTEFSEYNKLLLLFEDNYNHHIDRIYCHVQTCREFIPPFAVGRDGSAKCVKCQKITCGVCKKGWHSGPCTAWDG